MNYIQTIKAQLDAALQMPGEYKEVLHVYTLLVLVKGKDCTSQNVHDAWGIWANNRNPDHPSLIPFDALTKKGQGLDDLYRDAIINVSLLK